MEYFASQDRRSYSLYLDLNTWFRARKVTGNFEKRAPEPVIFWQINNASPCTDRLILYLDAGLVSFLSQWKCLFLLRYLPNLRLFRGSPFPSFARIVSFAKVVVSAIFSIFVNKFSKHCRYNPRARYFYVCCSLQSLLNLLFLPYLLFPLCISASSFL